MPENVGEAYRKELHCALEKCQFIEETLRMCILSALAIARIELSDYFPLKYKPEDISKLPLGSLVAVFLKINDDSNLHKDLKEITKKRNYVAHQSLLYTIGEWEDGEHLKSSMRKMKEIVISAGDVHNRVLDVRYELIRSLNKSKSSKNKQSSS